MPAISDTKASSSGRYTPPVAMSVIPFASASSFKIAMELVTTVSERNVLFMARASS